MHRTRFESIDLINTEIAGKIQYLALCIQTIFNEDPPTMDHPVCVFRNVLSINGEKQPWFWQTRPYFATASGELLVFRGTPTRCAGCGRRHILYGDRDSRNRVFCSRCPVQYPVTDHPTEPLIFRHGNNEVVLSCMPTAVWPDQFPVARFRDLIKRELGETENPVEEDGRDLDGLAGPSWFGSW